ncbi:zinc finger protein 652-like [Bombyx mandarina]|uniref:Zinc finger protein 652-like n=1 Tax=Bombyx mandarina TaxID=7092 RepID=A0A6J2K081_BOMMA|nr:zinc finger protein 652-like [Bombyx mandarina]
MAMNVIWTKDKLHKIFSAESISANVEASRGCRPTLARCRLCDGDELLRAFGDSCSWDGNLTYAQLLRDCFDVEVKSLNWLLCESCVIRLRNADRMKALVQAALDNTLTEATSNPSTRTLKKQNATNGQPTKRTNVNIGKKEPRKQRQCCQRYKRKHLICSVCGQKYFMIVNMDDEKVFTCSRCKKEGDRSSLCKRCDILVPSKMMKAHLELHVEADLRGKSRLRIQPKKAAQIRAANPKARALDKYECLQCLKRHKDVREYLNHMRIAHKVYTICKVCGRDMKTKFFLDKHLSAHQGNASRH